MSSLWSSLLHLISCVAKFDTCRVMWIPTKTIWFISWITLCPQTLQISPQSHPYYSLEQNLFIKSQQFSKKNTFSGVPILKLLPQNTTFHRCLHLPAHVQKGSYCFFLSFDECYFFLTPLQHFFQFSLEYFFVPLWQPVVLWKKNHLQSVTRQILPTSCIHNSGLD